MSTALRAAREALEDLWNQGISGHELLRRQTSLADEFIVDHFSRLSRQSSPPGGKLPSLLLADMGARNSTRFRTLTCCCSMTGGRQKICRGWQNRSSIRSGTAATRSVIPCGHRKRQCRFARNDFFFQVALLDARFLAGSSGAFRYTAEAISGKRYWTGAGKNLSKQWKRFRVERRKKYGSHSYLLEPHIKEGKGRHAGHSGHALGRKGGFRS